MEPLKEKAKKPKTISEMIYEEAIKNQGEKGEPIFFGEIRLFKETKRGNSTKTLKTFHNARKIVFSGELRNVKADGAVLLSCLTRIFEKKESV